MELLRKTFSWLLLGGIIATGCGHPPPIAIDDADSDCAWNQGGGSANRASYSPSDSYDNIGGLSWSKSFRKNVLAEPTAVFGKILIPVADRRLYIISENDGSRLARRKYKDFIIAPINLSDSLAVLVVEGERLIVENWITHRTLWEAELEASYIEPLVMNGNIYWIDGRNMLRAYRLDDGVRIWDKKLEGHFSCAIAGSSDGLLVVSDVGVIYCYEINSGQVKWKNKTGYRMRNVPVISGGDLIYCGTEGSVGKLKMSDGSSVWESDLQSVVIAPVASDGEGVYVGTNDRYIYRLDGNTGEIVWKTKIGGPVKAGPALTDRLAVFVSIDYRAYFADKSNGDILYRFKTGGMLTTRPLVCDGKVFIAGEDKKIYCFDLTGDE